MNHNAPIWANLSAQEHEFQYNPQCAFPDFMQTRANKAEPNQNAVARLRPVCNIAYGDHPLRTLDIYPAHTLNAPVHIFIHGGYWRAQDKANFAFVAGALAKFGMTSVIINYELCPDSTLDEVSDSAIAAFDWICEHIQNYGGDRSRISLSGHSAGAHLGAQIIAHPWPQPEKRKLLGAVLISGIYDPTPAIWTSVNHDLKLTEDMAMRNNVEQKTPILEGNIAILAGGREPWHWVDQSYRYYRHLRQSGREAALYIIPEYGHFDILDEFIRDRSLSLDVISSF